MEIEDEVDLLKSRFLSATKICSHIDENGTTASCCQIAHLTLESSLLASSAQCGLPGVLDYLQSKFRWGLVQENYFCDSLKTNALACGASTAIACWALEYYRDKICLNSSRTDHNYSVISVQTIMQCSKEDATLWYSEVQKRDGQSVDWICESCNFHECVGLIDNTTGELSVWDFGVWKRRHTLSESAGAMISVRLDTRCKGDSSRSKEYNSLMNTKVVWDGCVMELERWIDLPSESTVSPLSIIEQSSLLGELYADKSKALNHVLQEEQTPIIYITGVEMGSNPCAGVGVARAIRLHFPYAVLIAVDDGGGSAAGGMCDPVFNKAISIALMGGKPNHSNGSNTEKFLTAINLLAPHENAYFLPCRDGDILAMAEGQASYTDILMAPTINKGVKSEAYESMTYDSREGFHGICERILSPTLAAVGLSEKPNIMGKSKSALKEYFKIPEYLVLKPGEASWIEVQAFAERVGYPVVVKGASQGCFVCVNWAGLSYSLRCSFSEGGFVQKHVYGSDVTIAFAAFHGELSGCIRMTKESYTDVGKVWDGRISPVSKDLAGAIEGFIQDSNWTGGGELEMIEDFTGSLWMIDFNVRFPAWIFSSVFSGCNLPGELIEHAMHVHSHEMRTLLTPVEYTPFLHLPGKREAIRFARAAFTRSTIEIPRTNVTIDRTMRLPTCSLSNHTPQNKGGRASIKVKNGNPIHILPMNVEIDSDQDYGDDVMMNKSSDKYIDLKQATTRAISGVVHSVTRDITALGTAALAMLQESSAYTPQRILCMASVVESLERHERIFTAAAGRSRASITASNPGDTVPYLKLQLCLSVKTQPHSAVLAAAKAANYCAECISIAEVFASLDAGFPIEEVVLTGPGKFYDIGGRSERHLQGPLRAIFADTVADLRNIVSRVLDPTDWLDCNIIGVRWLPSWHVKSRFGLDPKDPKVVSIVAEIISALPLNKGVGMHFHYASSTVGADTWFGLATAFCHFSAGFAALANRPITVIDFGGGWSPHFYLEGVESTNKQLESLLQSVYNNFNLLQETLPVVQFEPGKSITESAGGIITRILGITELTMERPAEDTRKEGEGIPRALIVDTCIAEVSSPHIHPIFWRSQSDKSGSWLALPPGDDVIWGRTCMEFDLIPGSFKFPKDIQPGDYLLIAATGSYDFSNSYDFGDGIARIMTLL